LTTNPDHDFMIWVFYLQELKISLNKSAGCPPLPADFFCQKSTVMNRRSQVAGKIFQNKTVMDRRSQDCCL